MRDQTTPQLVETLSARVVTTALMARLDFKSGPIYVWTGAHPFQPNGFGDSLIDGQTFEPMAHGVVVDIGENTYKLTGSEELTITLNIPSSPDLQIAAAQTYPSEYQTRSAVIWRAIKIDLPDPLAEPLWFIRRTRAGSMDKLEIQADGNNHKFILSIEGHAGRISNATNQTYLNQRSYDPNDSSQDSAVAIANGSPGPTQANVTPSYGGGGGYYKNGEAWDREEHL